MLRILIFGILFMFSFGLLNAQNEKFLQANDAYNKSNFNKSIALFEEILSDEKESPDLYLNLGNAYLKSNRLGKAILNYEKGLSISKNHKSLAQNLKYAQKKIKTPITAIPDFFLSRYWNALVQIFNSWTWAMIQICLLVLIATAVGFWLLSRTLKLKRIAFSSLTVFAFLLFISLVAGASKDSLERDPKQAIIVTDEARLLTGASDKSELLLNLSQGVKVKLLDKIEDYYKVELLDKEVGWISEKEVETI